MLEPQWEPLLRAIVHTFKDPGGPMIIGVADGPEIEKLLFLSPGRSPKQFRESTNQPALLNAGISSDESLSKGNRLSASKTNWLLANGWNRPQHPFNLFFSISGDMGLGLNELLSHCLESFVNTFDLTGAESFSLNISAEDARVFQESMLTFDSTRGTWNIPGGKAKAAAPAFSKSKNSEDKFPQSKAKPSMEGVPTSIPDHGFHVGSEVSFSAKSSGRVVTIEAIFVGEKDGQARVEVPGSQKVPKGEYLVPFSIVKNRS
jgi:hypothetical protein